MAHLDPCSALSLPDMPSVLIGKADDKPFQQHMLLAPTIAGGIATAVGDLALHPIDTIKTVQQSAAAGSPSASIFGACSKIMREGGGLGGFYAGVGPYVTFDSLAGCVKFAAYEVCKTIADQHVDENLKPFTHFLSAAVAFIACSVVLVPGELMKQQLQAGMYRSVRACAAGILKKNGPRGFFQGYKATVVRDVPYTMLELGLYDNIKSLISHFRKKEGNANSKVDDVLAAAAVGGITGWITNPLDIIKTRMMTSGSAAPRVKTVVMDIIKKDGPRTFFAGSIARVSWLMPFTAIYLPTYDLVKSAIKEKMQD
ncbi:hypothetical protein GUITHDRAFT_120626 [Guillardia theta CCMP2712]|uniref:Mitochondrial carrier protein n=2 Tax=Guillardia theta TaxID=55529 RepID=L1IB91_GUITC|nr:hypothetical protein GUITHDRAFT_120626 [Guillardia theta CCMP2712]EKX33184.1 hypothetical protein GUITHDRAFT_120626 [Guillardia theta CCMP2712]|eukprot:XP_005820164.1 hypothetical protein GUITHDRAFT_120626 [Guillardia theta CCMP2712]